MFSGVDLFNIPGVWRRGRELPVGSERLNKATGALYVKISMKKIKKGRTFSHYHGSWALKKNLIWERHFGRIPKKYRVIFLDGNKSNYEIENLALATQNEIMLLRHYGLQFNDRESTRAGLAIARHRAAIGRLMKQTHNTYNMPKLKGER